MQLLTNTFDSFGLDIGDRSIKAAYIKKRGTDFELVSFGKQDIGSGVFSQGKIVEPKKLQQSILKLVSSMHGKKIPTSYVHACLPETHTFIKVLSIQPVSADKLPAQIREELPNHIPLNIDELYLDWHILPNPDEDQSNMNVLVGAIPKTTSDSYTNVLQQIGLKTISLQIEAEAILRGMLPLKTEYTEPLAVIDIGATRSSFVCYDKGTIQFTVSLPLASDEITRQIMQALKLSEEKAEQAKRLCGLDPDKCDQAILKVLEPAIGSLASSISQNSLFYTEHFDRAKPITSIMLCGGGANMRGIIKALSAKLPDKKIYLGNPLLNLTKRRKHVHETNKTNTSLDFIKNPKLTKDYNIPPEFAGSRQLSYATAIGLALTNVT